MDINCVNTCFYQRDGKCTLNELPSLTQAVGEHNRSMGCLYYTLPQEL